MTGIVSAISSVAKIAGPITSIISPIAGLASAGIGVASYLSSRNQAAKARASNAAIAAGLGASSASAAALQQQTIDTQTAVQNRQTADAANNSAMLDLLATDQQRVLAASRRSRGGLQFTGPATNLKTTLGG